MEYDTTPSAFFSGPLNATEIHKAISTLFINRFYYQHQMIRPIINVRGLLLLLLLPAAMMAAIAVVATVMALAAIKLVTI